MTQLQTWTSHHVQVVASIVQQNKNPLEQLLSLTSLSCWGDRVCSCGLAGHSQDKRHPEARRASRASPSSAFLRFSLRDGKAKAYEQCPSINVNLGHENGPWISPGECERVNFRSHFDPCVAFCSTARATEWWRNSCLKLVDTYLENSLGTFGTKLFMINDSQWCRTGT